MGQPEDSDNAAETGDALPSAENVPTIPYATPAPPLKLKTICRLPAFEANLAAAKLEAAGITCFVADQNISIAHPLLFGEVRLQVLEADVQRAEQILAARPVSSEAGTSDSADADDEYVEEAYRCPKCHRKAVDLMPLSNAMRSTRMGCLVVLFLPAIIGLVGWLVPDQTSRGGSSGNLSSTLLLVWMVVLTVLSYFVLTAKRTKRCRECGNQW